MSDQTHLASQSYWATVAIVHRTGPREIAQTIAAALGAFQVTRKLPARKRAEALEKIGTGISARREDFAHTITLETIKPIKSARAEVDRAIFTFKVAAQESKRIHGDIISLDWLPGNEGRAAQVRRVPLGPIAGISPFNLPLNLVAHKVAPSFAAGNPIIHSTHQPDPRERAQISRDRPTVWLAGVRI